MDDIFSLNSSKEPERRILHAIISGAPNEFNAQAGVALLRKAGALAAVVPAALGGLGFGTEARGASGLCDLLRLIGKLDLSLGRIYEGHVNSVQLVCRYGSAHLVHEVAHDAVAGHLFAIWNTETPPGVKLNANGSLNGKKSFCSAAGLATRAVITVDQSKTPGGQMALVQLAPGERVTGDEFELHGMRGAKTSAMDFTDCRLEPWRLFGQPGDYLLEPVFSGGAWRALAVLLGGLERLTEECFHQLRRTRHDGTGAQRLRIAAMAVGVETARLWVDRCADVVERSDYGDPASAHYVGLARQAFERAAFESIENAQRCIGLSAMSASNPLESLMRDLTTYLRQPALDAAVEDAAAWFVDHPLPRLLRDAR